MIKIFASMLLTLQTIRNFSFLLWIHKSNLVHPSLHTVSILTSNFK